MLYKKNGSERLSPSLFENPTSEYRGTPFWAWNTELDKEELLRQIEVFRQMGFGGFHMHSRAGMATEYLGRDFMELVKACNEKAKAEGMLTWLYDEDRYPSGFAGGIVTENPKYRQKLLKFTVTPRSDATDAQTGYETGRPYLLATYDVILNEDGTLKRYARIAEDTEAEGTKWYVYVTTPPVTGRFNGYTYVDTMSEEAIAEFIRVTYDAYLEAVGEDFGRNIPSIFTDEPQMCRKRALPFATSKNDIDLPYTTDFAKTFFEAYGVDLLDHLPELLWNLPNGQISKVRYCYHDHACDRFTKAFADQCGAWCQEHGIELTGHVLNEDTLYSQTNSLGEAMRSYRSFGIPGIDMLCNDTIFTTAKQCQSAVNQYGREAMLSELYGVTGWDFDFRGHKYQGDWQAALGVSVRVPHLSWVSMKGSAKRDYPASISYQSAWYREYSYIENHFSRLNTALTRGKPSVKVGVLHPVESYWLHYGPEDSTAEVRRQLENNFKSVTDWLLFGTIDFDFISESLLPSLYRPTEDHALQVGEMAYSAVIVPAMETLRSSTCEILEQYVKKGGKLIFMGDCPAYVDAERSDRVRVLYSSSVVVPVTKHALLSSLEDERDISIRSVDGMMTDNLIYRMREDHDCNWLFVACGKDPSAFRARRGTGKHFLQQLSIRIKGEWYPTVYDTVSGKIYQIPFEYDGEYTRIHYKRYESDSLLLKLSHTREAEGLQPALQERAIKSTMHLSGKWAYTLSEPNVMVLDIAQLSEDGVHYGERDELLRADKMLRGKYEFPMASGRDLQPWKIEREKITHYPYLKFTFESEIEVDCQLAFEELDSAWLNGKQLQVISDGYYVDKDIHTMPIGKIREGSNELILRVPFGKRISFENFFLLGAFGVRVEGDEATVVALPEKLTFTAINDQLLPFYGAGVTYHCSFTLPHDADVEICAEQYQGAVIGVRVDGEEQGRIAFSPYTLPLNGLTAGEHTLELTLYATRTNSFNALHNCNRVLWQGPEFWYPQGSDWSWEYVLTDQGFLKAPRIHILT